MVAFCGEQETGNWESEGGEEGEREEGEGTGAGPRLVAFCGEQEPGIWEPDSGEWGRLEDWERGAGGGGIPFLVLVARLAEGLVCRSTEEEVLEGLPGELKQGGGGTLCCENFLIKL